MEGTPLLDVMRGLILEPEAQAEFAADPSGYMQRFGYDDVPEDDLREAVDLVADTLPPDVAHAVNTAAAAEPSDDAYGDGTVGLLGRISTAEVTESVVPDLGPLPDESDDGGVADDVADDHDATAFGDVTHDFDDDESADDDALDDASGSAPDADPEDTDDALDEAGDTVVGAGADGEAALADADVSFGEGGAGGDVAGGADGLDHDGSEAFGQGSGADLADPASPDDIGVDVPADAGDPDAFDADTPIGPEPGDAFDEIDDDALADGLGAYDEIDNDGLADGLDVDDDPAGIDDGDVGTF